MPGPVIKSYTYTKEGGDTSVRRLITETSPDLVLALDVTQDPNPEATLAAYAEYQSAFSAHKKAFPTFEAWAEQNGRPIMKPAWRSFKTAGLKAN